MELFAIQMQLPDSLHWFAGIDQVYKQGRMVLGLTWTPNPENALLFTRKQASRVAKDLLKEVPGLLVVPANSLKTALKPDPAKNGKP